MRRSGKAALRLIRGQQGLNLVEVVIALALVGVIGVGILQAMETGARSTRTLDEKVVAANLIADHIEAIKQLSFAATYPGAGENITVPFQYTVNIDTECSNDGGATYASCSGNGTFQKIVVSVSRGDNTVLSVCAFRTKRTD